MLVNQRLLPAILLLAAGPRPAAAQRDDKPVPLPGPVIFDARAAKDLKGLPIREGVQFGAFRDDRLGKDENWVEYWVQPGDDAGSFLAIYYNVSKRDTYNGVFFKLGGADWTRYAGGEIVLRLCRFPPLHKVQIFDEAGGRLRDTPCTDNIKVELKAGRKPNGEPERFAIRRSFTSRDLAQQNRVGFFDVRIPVAGFGLDRHLDRAAELALVFEERAFKTNVRGNLGLQAIVVLPERGTVVDLDRLRGR